MSSAQQQTTPGPTPAPTSPAALATSDDAAARSLDDDRSTAARIRDAAVVCFARAGVAATSVRTIAAEADVSPALVIHHFGSKDQLRVVCDEHVAAVVRDQKQAAMAAGAELDVLGALRTQGDGPPVLAYLARTLVDGSPHVVALVDELVTDAVDYMAVGVANGVLQPSADPRARAALLTIWSLGALVLHEHTTRLLGADLLADPAEAAGYLQAGLEIFGQGVLTPTTYRAVVAQLEAATTADGMTDDGMADDGTADPDAATASETGAPGSEADDGTATGGGTR